MSGNLLHVGATMACSHQGQVTATPTSPRVRVAGQVALTMADVFTVAGCPFTLPGPAPQPCIRLQWIQPATRVRIGGTPAVLSTGQALCLGPTQAPQGTAQVMVSQTRVRGQ